MSDDRHEDCPARRVLDHLAARWAVPVLTALGPGPLRYHQLRATLGGISDKMLTSTLQTLAGDGFVHREVTTDQPPQVTYSMTDDGRSAIGALEPFVAWSRARLAGPVALSVATPSAPTSSPATGLAAPGR